MPPAAALPAAALAAAPFRAGLAAIAGTLLLGGSLFSEGALRLQYQCALELEYAGAEEAAAVGFEAQADRSAEAASADMAESASLRAEAAADSSEAAGEESAEAGTQSAGEAGGGEEAAEAAKDGGSAFDEAGSWFAEGLADASEAVQGAASAIAETAGAASSTAVGAGTAAEVGAAGALGPAAPLAVGGAVAAPKVAGAVVSETTAVESGNAYAAAEEKDVEAEALTASVPAYEEGAAVSQKAASRSAVLAAGSLLTATVLQLLSLACQAPVAAAFLLHRVCGVGSVAGMGSCCHGFQDVGVGGLVSATVGHAGISMTGLAAGVGTSLAIGSILLGPLADTIIMASDLDHGNLVLAKVQELPGLAAKVFQRHGNNPYQNPSATQDQKRMLLHRSIRGSNNYGWGLNAGLFPPTQSFATHQSSRRMSWVSDMVESGENITSSLVNESEQAAASASKVTENLARSAVDAGEAAAGGIVREGQNFSKLVSDAENATIAAGQAAKTAVNHASIAQVAGEASGGAAMQAGKALEAGAGQVGKQIRNNDLTNVSADVSRSKEAAAAAGRWSAWAAQHAAHVIQNVSSAVARDPKHAALVGEQSINSRGQTAVAAIYSETAPGQKQAFDTVLCATKGVCRKQADLGTTTIAPITTAAPPQQEGNLSIVLGSISHFFAALHLWAAHVAWDISALAITLVAAELLVGVGRHSVAFRCGCIGRAAPVGRLTRDATERFFWGLSMLVAVWILSVLLAGHLRPAATSVRAALPASRSPFVFHWQAAFFAAGVFACVLHAIALARLPCGCSGECPGDSTRGQQYSAVSDEECPLVDVRQRSNSSITEKHDPQNRALGVFFIACSAASGLSTFVFTSVETPLWTWAFASTGRSLKTTWSLLPLMPWSLLEREFLPSGSSMVLACLLLTFLSGFAAVVGVKWLRRCPSREPHATPLASPIAPLVLQPETAASQSSSRDIIRAAMAEEPGPSPLE